MHVVQRESGGGYCPSKIIA